MNRILAVAFATCAVYLLQCQADAATISPGKFQLFDHPDGTLTDSHGPYGLRLDGDEPPVGNGPTFSVQADSEPVILTWNLDNTATIEGRLRNNTTGEFWEVSYTMTGLFDNNGGFTATAGSGTLVWDEVGVPPSNSPIVLTGMQNNAGQAFNLFPDGHRLDNDNMSTVGRGWLDDDGNNNDWLVIAVQTQIFKVPEPSTMVLCTVGIAGLFMIRRRRQG